MNPFPLSESSHKHTTAGQSDCACGKNLFCPGFVAFIRSFWIEGFESARRFPQIDDHGLCCFPHLHVRLISIIIISSIIIPFIYILIN